MGLLLDLIIGTAADLFGKAVGHERPWWVEFVAAVGFMLAVAVPIVLLVIFLS